MHVFPGLISKERVFTIIEKLLASPIDDDNIVASGQLLETAFLMTKNHPKASKLSREQHLQELLKEFILRCIGMAVFYIIYWVCKLMMFNIGQSQVLINPWRLRPKRLTPLSKLIVFHR